MVAKISDRVSTRKLANDEPIQAYDAAATLVRISEVSTGVQHKIAAGIIS